VEEQNDPLGISVKVNMPQCTNEGNQNKTAADHTEKGVSKLYHGYFLTSTIFKYGRRTIAEMASFSEGSFPPLEGPQR
jgi:hypothetical protein